MAFGTVSVKKTSLLTSVKVGSDGFFEYLSATSSHCRATISKAVFASICCWYFGELFQSSFALSFNLFCSAFVADCNSEIVCFCLLYICTGDTNNKQKIKTTAPRNTVTANPTAASITFFLAVSPPKILCKMQSEITNATPRNSRLNAGLIPAVDQTSCKDW